MVRPPMKVASPQLKRARSDQFDQKVGINPYEPDEQEHAEGSLEGLERHRLAIQNDLEDGHRYEGQGQKPENGLKMQEPYCVVVRGNLADAKISRGEHESQDERSPAGAGGDKPRDDHASG